MAHHTLPPDHPYDYSCSLCHAANNNRKATVITWNGFPCCEDHADLVAAQGLQRAILTQRRSMKQPA